MLEIKEAFDLFDTDGGGSIDPKGTSEIISRTQGCNDFARFRIKKSNDISNDFRS